MELVVDTLSALGQPDGRQEGSRRTAAAAEGIGEEERSKKTPVVDVGTAGGRGGEGGEVWVVSDARRAALGS